MLKAYPDRYHGSWLGDGVRPRTNRNLCMHLKRTNSIFINSSAVIKLVVVAAVVALSRNLSGLPLARLYCANRTHKKCPCTVNSIKSEMYKLALGERSDAATLHHADSHAADKTEHECKCTLGRVRFRVGEVGPSKTDTLTRAECDTPWRAPLARHGPTNVINAAR